MYFLEARLSAEHRTGALKHLSYSLWKARYLRPPSMFHNFCDLVQHSQQAGRSCALVFSRNSEMPNRHANEHYLLIRRKGLNVVSFEDAIGVRPIVRSLGAKGEKSTTGGSRHSKQK
jgi:hypothetical protein